MLVGIYGAGQYGMVLWDCLTIAGHTVVGFVDDHRQGSLYDLPIVREARLLARHDAVAIAIGDNRARKSTFVRLKEVSESVCSVIHPSAVVATRAQLGEGVAVLAGTIVSTDVTIGDGAVIDVRTMIGHHAAVGAFVHAVDAVVGARASIGEGAFLGLGSTVLPDIVVGDWSSCLGGAYVTRSVAHGATVVGTPARQTKAGLLVTGDAPTADQVEPRPTEGTRDEGRS